MRKYTSAAQMPLWKWILCLVFGLFIFMFLYGLSEIALDKIPQGDAWQCGASVLLAFLGLLLYAIWGNLTEKRPVEELRLSRLFPDLGKGLLFGALIFGAVVGIMALVGSYQVTEAHFLPLPLLRAFCMFLVVAVYEEIIFRGILFRLIDDRWNTGVALIVSALVFGFVHMMNSGASLWSSLAIAIEAGLLLGAAFKFSKTLWLPIGIHWAWNFVQGNVFGFRVSGGDAGDHIISAIISGPDLVTGGVFGAEASVITVGIGLILTIVFLACAPKGRR